MSAIAFDTHAYVKKLKAAGFTEQQAEAQAEALAGVVDANLATKQDIAELRVELKRDIETLRAELKRDIEALRAELKSDIAGVIKWVAGLLLAQAALITTLGKLIS